MDFSITGILLADGLTNGAIYGLVALALVLVFAVTRVIFIPQGEYVALAALSMAALQSGQVPGTTWLLVILACACALASLVRGLRAGRSVASCCKVAARTLAWPLAVALATWWLVPQGMPMVVQIVLALALVTALGPLIYDIAYQPIAHASVLVLLMVSVGVHFVLTGLGLIFFGAEGFRTPAFWDQRIDFHLMSVSGQAVIILAAAAALIAVLYVFFRQTLSGKALRATAVNRSGARLLGISADGAGRLSFTLAAFIGALSGVMIGPTTTIFYDSGFIIGLKGFVAAVFAGLTSFPLALSGALLLGVIESFSSFWASAFKEVIVFTVILPVLAWRSVVDAHAEEH